MSTSGNYGVHMVYILQLKGINKRDCWVKVGTTKDIVTRIKKLKKENGHMSVELVAAGYTKNRAAALKVESDLRVYFLDRAPKYYGRNVYHHGNDYIQNAKYDFFNICEDEEIIFTLKHYSPSFTDRTGTHHRNFIKS